MKVAKLFQRFNLFLVLRKFRDWRSARKAERGKSAIGSGLAEVLAPNSFFGSGD